MASWGKDLQALLGEAEIDLPRIAENLLEKLLRSTRSGSGRVSVSDAASGDMRTLASSGKAPDDGGSPAVLSVPIILGTERAGELILAEPEAPYGEEAVSAAEEAAEYLAAATRLSREAAALRKAKESAEQAIRAQSDFFASMSHELRTPLNSILGFAQLLSMDETGPLSERQRAYLEEIRSGGGRLSGMIGTILDAAKIETGGVVLEMKPFDLGASLLALADTLRSAAEEKGLRFGANIPKDLGPLTGDETRVRQACYIMLSGAIQSASPGGAVDLEVSAAGDRASVVVRSDGAESSGEDWGLSVARRIVELHGGSLVRRQGDDQGVLAIAEFPGREPERRARPEAPAGAGTGSGNAPSRGDILVVEDNPVNQKLIAAVLSTYACSSMLVSSGEEALEAARIRDFHLVLMDINLPGIDGIETMKRLRGASDPAERRRAGFRIPVVALTAHTMRGDRERFIAEGMDEVLPKPLDLKKLKEIIDKYLPGRCGDEHRYDPAAVAEAMSLPLETFNGLISYFFSHLADPYTDALADAIESSDLPRIASAAHRLRGSTATLRFSACTALLEEIEKAAGSGEATDYRNIFSRVRQDLDRLRADTAVVSGEASGKADPVDRLSGLEGADTAKGLLLAGGDRSLYADLLVAFSRSYGSFGETLDAALSSGVTAEARRLVHGLKGAAANLGLSAVEAAARRAEEALSSTDGAGMGIGRFGTLMAEVLAVVDALRGFNNS